jgi:hypothetical protein
MNHIVDSTIDRGPGKPLEPALQRMNRRDDLMACRRSDPAVDTEAVQFVGD